MSAETEAQKALYTALNGLGLRVYDVAPQAADGASTATYPYVEVGAVVLTPFDTFEESGFIMAARVHTRSRSGSMAEAKSIQGQIWARLHRGTLTMTGLRLVDMTREASDCTRAPDGSFHGVCEYRGQIVPS
jgi:hypothetical protein